MRPEIETLIGRAESFGATFRVDGKTIKVSAPEPLPADLMEALRARKAAVLSFLALPEEFRTTVRWGAWMAEHTPANEAAVRFNETPLRPVTLRLSNVGRYLSELLGRLSLLRSWEGSNVNDVAPGWRIERMRELCGTIEDLRKALGPFGLDEVSESR